MSRRPQLYLPNIPCLVSQTCIGDFPCFSAHSDYKFYLECMEEAAQDYGCHIHAYALTQYHILLLVTPQLKESIPRLMQSVSRRYIHYLRRAYGRTGPVWRGRLKSCLIEPTNVGLLQCYCYIERYPELQDLSMPAVSYCWSSHAYHAYGNQDEVISPHPAYVQLGASALLRQADYRALFKLTSSADHLSVFQRALETGVPVGSDQFRVQLGRQLNRHLGYKRRGRPPKFRQAELATHNQTARII